MFRRSTVIAALALLATVASAKTLQWLPPTHNVDGSELTDLAGFKIYYGTAPRSYTGVIDIEDPAQTIYEFDVVGSWYITMTALNEANVESAYSNEVFEVIASDEPPPKPGDGHLTIMSWGFEATQEPIFACDCPNYELKTLDVGVTMYVDRSFKFTDVGPYAGRQFLSTANSDKLRTGTPYIDVGDVLVAVDVRAVNAGLFWLAGWTDTGNTIAIDEGSMFRVFSGSGPLNGPGCHAGGCGNMIVIFQ